MLLLSILHHAYTDDSELVLGLYQNPSRFIRSYTPMIAYTVPGEILYESPMLFHAVLRPSLKALGKTEALQQRCVMVVKSLPKNVFKKLLIIPT